MKHTVSNTGIGSSELRRFSKDVSHARGSASAAEDAIAFVYATDALGQDPLGWAAAPAKKSASSARDPHQRPVGGVVKRAMDIAVAATAITLAAPIMLVIAMVVAAEGGPVLYAHERIGFKGRPFRCYKFRSMVTDPDAALERHLARNPAAATEWKTNKKLKDDPRITRSGRLLRVSSLDELPQLFNIIRGEMSCVGPRPVTADELPRYGHDASQYLRTRPGLTGLWQVSGRSSLSYERRVELDSLYVRTWSAWKDIAILARTAFAVIRTDETS